MKLFAGSYTEPVLEGLSGHGEGIYIFDFNEESGKLVLELSEKNRNTAYLTVNRKKNLIYTFQEIIQENHPLLLTYELVNNVPKLINKQFIPGGLPCHLTNIKESELLTVACYQTGNVIAFPLINGLPERERQNIKHIGSSLNKTRQEGPHAHMTFFNDYDGKLYVPDLGLDQVIVYDISDLSQLSFRYGINIPKGNGPRHITFHPTNEFAFVMNELTGSVSLLKNNNGKFEWISEHETLPKDHTTVPSASAIKISNDGQFIYCGNRSNHVISILQFDHQSESMHIIDHQSSYGETPRDFTLSPSGKWMIVANQDSDNVIVFKVDIETGLLQKFSIHENLKSIVCLTFGE
ncbi:MAG: lactonase family protein [Reichenbachiella sp.]